VLRRKLAWHVFAKQWYFDINSSTEEVRGHVRELSADSSVEVARDVSLEFS